MFNVNGSNIIKCIGIWNCFESVQIKWQIYFNYQSLLITRVRVYLRCPYTNAWIYNYPGSLDARVHKMPRLD